MVIKLSMMLFCFGAFFETISAASPVSEENDENSAPLEAAMISLVLDDTASTASEKSVDSAGFHSCEEDDPELHRQELLSKLLHLIEYEFASDEETEIEEAKARHVRIAEDARLNRLADQVEAAAAAQDPTIGMPIEITYFKHPVYGAIDMMVGSLFAATTEYNYHMVGYDREAEKSLALLAIGQATDAIKTCGCSLLGNGQWRHLRYLLKKGELVHWCFLSCDERGKQHNVLFDIARRKNFIETYHKKMADFPLLMH